MYKPLGLAASVSTKQMAPADAPGKLKSSKRVGYQFDNGFVLQEEWE